MQEDLREKAFRFAKQRGDTTVSKKHLLLAVVLKFRDPLAELGITYFQVATLIGPEGESITAPSGVDEECQATLQQFTTQQTAIDWAVAYVAAIREQPNTSDGVTTAPRQSAGAIVHAERDTTQSVAAPKRNLELIYADLDALVGLQPVKEAVRAIVARQKAMAVMQERGQPVVFSKHLVFTGAPGTGKTTVARYVGELYAAINVLPTTAFVEVNRSDLIGEYVGQTAPKVKKVIEQARGGVLFIDEAYALAPNHSSDYGHEALATLVQLMENYRDELVVIMAGYHAEMQHLIDTNPGLRSRMTTYIEFPNYAPDELTTIFAEIVAKHGVNVSANGRTYLETKLREIAEHADFGNARFVRSVWEHAFSHLAVREFSDEKFEESELRELDVTDIEYALKQLGRGLKEPPKRMGFRGV
jgi:stage V sporulation protein K